MDFDPRECDSRDEERFDPTRDRGGRGGSGELHSEESGRDARDDTRMAERGRDERMRDNDLRDVFTRHLNLPRGLDRELVRDRGREYTLRGSESRTLATVGAFRVVSSRDLRDHNDRPADPRSGDLKRERELNHDVQVYRAYERAAKRLADRGGHVDRVLLDHQLKREYQSWLHARDRERADYDGHPDRTGGEVNEWAREHGLPYFEEQVHFPDLRIEYRDRDGREDHEDIEVTTEHYRGAHAASVARSGFSCYGGSSRRIGRGGSSRGGGGHHGGLAEEMLG
jgi:hypothetical protein